MKFNIEEIQIGKQIWSISNLGLFTFRNGDAITEAKSEDEWHNLYNKKMPACAFLDYKKSKSKNEGLIYNGYAITDMRNLAPEGWRLPAKKDWEILAKFLKEDEAKKIFENLYAQKLMTLYRSKFKFATKKVSYEEFLKG